MAQSTAGGEALLRAVLDIAYRGLVGEAKAREFLRLMIGEASRVPDLAKFYLQEITGRGNRALLGVLEKGAATGEFSADALARFKAMPEALVAPIVMAALQRLTSNHWDEVPDLEAQMAAHLDLILNGLRPR
ncbi:TetR/AcrR family transcriptional regulator C-terminal domain-containing protein [Oleomonas cavernae]|uniref:TetR/AcrR family transcriptional regulator C-terminal domain-containing protein n=1 Tax=Oleomonas cavernae TaxID=2320859 RepID=UPI0011C47927|nr:TetR/AcrR family transcriptional regulator C-terminal domain-containing protein [Oleomonas cavernae]